MFVVLLSSLAIAVGLPAIVLGIECLLATLPLRRDRRAERGECPSLAVLVPAHNEQAGITETIETILPQLNADDRLIVIADNCSDQTASIARHLGATVTERTDSERRGKGYAIRHALEQLADNPPEVVVCIDADCIPLPGCIERIARAAVAADHPIQAAYVMHPPEDASPSTLISAFAVLVKNYVRPRGLQRIKSPCLITGSGVAYPWQVLQRVPHPGAHIVEDMHYSIDLALAGCPPQPCMEAVVESRLPDTQSAAQTQRTRWEHGHLSVLCTQGPRLMAGAMKQRSMRLFVLGLELMVPPLSLLIMFCVLASGMFLLAAIIGNAWGPLWIVLTSGGLGAIGLSAAWWRFGRRMLPFGMLLRVPRYIVSKLSIYRRFLSSPETTWIRTARDPLTSSSTTGPHFNRPSTTADETISAE